MFAFCYKLYEIFYFFPYQFMNIGSHPYFLDNCCSFHEGLINTCRVYINSSGSHGNSQIAHGFVQEFHRSRKHYRPGQKLKRLDKSCSLHSKKLFLVGGCGFFVSNIISGGP